MKKFNSEINDAIAWRLLYIWIVATAALFLVQFVSDHQVDASVLTYLLPGCTASYLFGRRDGFRERGTEEDANGEK
jgi:hypothetical protein